MAIMQKVMAKMQVDSQGTQVKNEELSTEVAVGKADLDQRVAEGNSKLKADAEEGKEAQEAKEHVDQTKLPPVVKQGLQEMDKVTEENNRLREQVEEATARQSTLEERSFKDRLDKTVYEIQ